MMLVLTPPERPVVVHAQEMEAGGVRGDGGGDGGVGGDGGGSGGAGGEGGMGGEGGGK